MSEGKHTPDNCGFPVADCAIGEEFDNLRRQNADMLAVLKSVEWGDVGKRCPYCGEARDYRNRDDCEHVHGCELKAAIDKATVSS